jgi:hypothetical protein
MHHAAALPIASGGTTGGTTGGRRHLPIVTGD